MMKELVLHAGSENDLIEVAKNILNAYPGERIFALKGELGAGKTALIRAFCEILDVGQPVVSPSFALVNEYLDEEGKPVYHFDFYRIKKLEEVLDIGYEEYFYSGYYCFLEWADRITELLPARHVYIDIRVEGEKGRREFRVSGL
jgi:tRNA threonylcarbamoyladenosine biosynthesis protein TsaE